MVGGGVEIRAGMRDDLIETSGEMTIVACNAKKEGDMLKLVRDAGKLRQRVIRGQR
jgi:hypothetical protein